MRFSNPLLITVIVLVGALGACTAPADQADPADPAEADTDAGSSTAPTKKPLALEQAEKLAGSQTAEQSTTETAPEAGAGQTVSLTIDGMHCGGCANRIEHAMAQLSGVTSCEVEYLEDGKGSAVFVIDEKQQSADELVAALKDLDFEASLAKDADAAAATP